jgi:hypothetical protein
MRLARHCLRAEPKTYGLVELFGFDSDPSGFALRSAQRRFLFQSACLKRYDASTSAPSNNVPGREDADNAAFLKVGGALRRRCDRVRERCRSGLGSD